MCRALSNVADEGLLTEGWFWIPSLAGPSSLASRASVSTTMLSALYTCPACYDGFAEPCPDFRRCPYFDVFICTAERPGEQPASYATPKMGLKIHCLSIYQNFSVGIDNFNQNAFQSGLAACGAVCLPVSTVSTYCAPAACHMPTARMKVKTQLYQAITC